MSSVVRGGHLCQPPVDEGRDEARASGSKLSRERADAHGRGERDSTDDLRGRCRAGASHGSRRAYRTDRSKAFVTRDQANDPESWLEAAKEIFSSPLQNPRGEKISLPFAVDEPYAESSPAGGVIGPEGPARCLPGVDVPSCEGSSSLLDYRLTQGEKRRASLTKLLNAYVSPTVDMYRYRAVIAGHVVKLYKYETAQKCQKGKSCKERGRRLDRTEEERQRDRTRNNWRARNGLIDTINANVDRPWGERLKFFTMTFRDDIFDLKEGNSQFNKFIKRLEYQIKRKVHYTVIARFQDGKRPGGRPGGRDGVIHYHVLFYDLPYVPHERLTTIWGHGFVYINAVNDVDNIGVYMVEGYMGKEMDDERLNGQKHYWSSRDMIKPSVMYGRADLKADLGIENREPVYRKTFVSDYVGTVEYEQYNLKREGKVYARKKKESGTTGISGTPRNDHEAPGARVDLVPALREGVPAGRSTVGLGE